MRFSLAIPVSLLASIVAPAQSGSLATQYVVRLERTTPYENVCALVRADASYRLEETHQKRVYEGQLASDAMAALRKLVEDPAVASLSQAQVEAPAIEAPSFDRMRMMIARDYGWQDLRFRSPDRKPIRQQVEAFQDFLGSLRNSPKTPLADSDANACMPPAATQAPVSLSGSLVWMRLIHTGEDLVIHSSVSERRCLLVSANGQYRYERSSQPFGGKLEGNAYQAMLPPESLEQLRTLLAAPELINARSQEVPTLVYRDAEATDVVIQRDSGAQELSAIVASGVSQSGDVKTMGGKLVGGIAQTGGAYRNFSFGPLKELKPLLAWLKAVERRKGTLIKGAVLNDCQAVTSE